jgi:hypothetical protein
MVSSCVSCNSGRCNSGYWGGYGCTEHSRGGVVRSSFHAWGNEPTENVTNWAQCGELAGCKCSRSTCTYDATCETKTDPVPGGTLRANVVQVGCLPAISTSYSFYHSPQLSTCLDAVKPQTPGSATHDPLCVGSGWRGPTGACWYKASSKMQSCDDVCRANSAGACIISAQHWPATSASTLEIIRGVGGSCAHYSYNNVNQSWTWASTPCASCVLQLVVNSSTGPMYHSPFPRHWNQSSINYCQFSDSTRVNTPTCDAKVDPVGGSPPTQDIAHRYCPCDKNGGWNQPTNNSNELISPTPNHPGNNFVYG